MYSGRMLGSSLCPFARSFALFAAAFALPLTAACGDDGTATPDAGPDDPPDAGPLGSLEDHLPPLPEPTGEPQAVFAGQVETADQLIEGPAKSGIVGDYYIRNSDVSFIIQSPRRVIGVVPQGGNVVDAVALDDTGAPITGDHFGELSLVYTIGRTCEHNRVEVIQDGSGGGAAVIRAIGKTGNNDFINLKGTGLLGGLIPSELSPQDPGTDDGVDCATTYILHPDSTKLEVTWTLFNGTTADVFGPIGAFNDTGGEIEVFSPTVGFRRIGLDNILGASEPTPVPYSVYQGPGVAYGVVPVHADAATPNASFLVAGVSVMLFGADALLDIIDAETYFLDLPSGAGVNQSVNLSVGRDAADVEALYRANIGEETATLTGEVSWTSGEAGAGVRVGIYEDADDSGDVTAEDIIRTYVDTAADGTFSANVVPGNYLLRAEVQDLARSAAISVDVTASGASGANLELPDPAVIDYQVNGDLNLIPAKITVIGDHPAFPDERLFSNYDRQFGVIRMVRSIHGTTTSVGGDPADPKLVLPQGGPYKIIATRGTEWSFDAIVIDDTTTLPDTPLVFSLTRVADAEGYVSSEYHVHSIASPDSPVLQTTRVATAIADGIEAFASTDHGFVADLQPVIEAMGVADLVRNIPGLEITTFSYGHFNAYPLEPDPTSPNFGAIDWARTDSGYGMLPGEIMDAAFARGAEVVQVNHPRTSSGLASFQQYFDRAGLVVDYDAREVLTDPLKQPVSNETLRLPPDASLWDPGFNALEVWNGFDVGDINSDGVRELTRLDLVMADWFNFLSLGMDITPVGNSDTHTIIADPMGMPRTYVRVLDDSPQALDDGSVVDQIIDTLAGRNGSVHDVIVTDGPFIEVTLDGSTASAIGATVDGSGGITLDISVTSAGWAEIDTIEVFANNTPPIGDEALEQSWVPRPVACFTAREGTPAPNDPCALAPINGSLDVTTTPVGDAARITASVQVAITADDIPTREGATGEDAWMVIRARGDRGIFPVLLKGAITEANLDTLVSGTDNEIDAALDGAGVPATAFTAPIFVDFDGDGYVAPFSPQ